MGIFRATATKSALKKAIKKRYITVNGEVAGTGKLLQGGETIALTVPEKNRKQTRLDFPLKTLFEDDYLAVIHKPSGIVVSGNKHRTIANALAQNLKPGTLSDATNPQPVHRLDYLTTGALLVGKTHDSIRVLNKMFADKAIAKEYFAITIGKMQNEGLITAPVDGKKAQTHYQVTASVASPRFGSLNLVRLRPKTGRRHQLRKHLYGIGHPILGDKEYAIDGFILRGKGLYLHACSLEFQHPFSNEHICIKDALPKKFMKIFTEKGEQQKLSDD
ncbi:RluA family pseudouridine synthase [Robertkochia flava]|uniref:RluA family pseudouridine synthase n=1 Tax=Robertkochia flava TaxID=3447986 RepID=UPI001CCC4C90|nr:RluA family pseudouridine synthase [Robertkochia marina]